MKIIPLFNNEKQLVKKAQKGERLAQKAIYKKYAPKMLSVCRMYVHDLHFAEDVLLRGFLKVFNNLNQFAFKGSLEGWIRRIITREAIDFIRTQKQLDLSKDLENQPQLSVNAVESQDELIFIQRLIDELPEGYKVVFVLFCVEGYKHKEIAKMLNISVGTSKSQLAKARKELQKKLNQKTWEDEFRGIREKD